MFKSLFILILLSLCIGTGAWLFFIWAVKKGAFDDIEGPKHRMLDDEDISDSNTSSEETKDE